ncbi:lysine transporter LysE [Corynebacterium sp. HMSC08C04]|uniref:Lysine transporter LysE n=2 Tax=Corynebacterium TaxID=1716 RepID=A0A2A4AHD6_9CORY|nr:MULTISPECIES: LysE/ArgO family amino acid transporter [Corynebacterium]PCC81892.1 lysine transporter LysE [Corynebacterium accolens]MCG7246809.1 LysE/ArgO family amino acid transporter [Corynebacterium simulans]OFM00896.1 lysine transporter LysE [Corynebacterium sp. HMSC071F07]OFQ43298.1 lysine transporter LysE [Corynebacterium sp. HMSC076D02]OFR39128.1 lysine transporter LysE [Corynebacterium sp. HMSC077D03]
MSILLAGFLLGLSLIIAIGPQNAYIIKMGVKRDHISAIILACLLSDVILINAGVGGMGVLVEKFPTGLVIMKYLGAAYLLYFGFSCFRDAFKKEQEALVVENTQPTVQPQSVHGSTAVITAPRLKSRTWLKPVMGAMALTWLNPLTYVDVLVMLGGIAQQYGQQRWLFAAGALLASAVWFPTLGYGAFKLSPVLAKPTTWRYVNFAIGCVMMVLTAKLLLH